MILRAFQVENWCCIRKLEIADLPDGIAILYGPNQTGKSSLLAALRSCLLDCDHNSGKVTSRIPWDGSGPPKVAVEFNVAGSDYRITKVFSKKSDGNAQLERKIDSRWAIEQDAPKEASRRARELLGIKKSDEGLNQLLWLDQGQTTLPVTSALDDSLKHQLGNVVGIMVTGRDHNFKLILDQRCGKYFTGSRGDYKSDSAVKRWENEKLERQNVCESARLKLRQLEETLSRLNISETETQQTKREVESAKNEVLELEKQCELAKERVQTFRSAEQALQVATDRLTQAEEVLQCYLKGDQRLQTSVEDLKGSREATRIAQTQRDHLAVELQKTQQSLNDFRLRQRVHLQERESLELRRRLLEISESYSAQVKLQNEVKRKEEELVQQNSDIQSLRTPNATSLKSLQDKRRNIQRLSVQLKASELVVSLKVRPPLSVRMNLDSGISEELQFPTQGEMAWTFRHHAAIAVGEIASVEIRRSESNQDLEQLTKQLEKETAEFEAEVRSFGEDPTRDDCLERLLATNVRKSEWEGKVRELRKNLEALSPDGTAALQLALVELDRQRQVVLKLRPSFCECEPTRSDVEVLEKDIMQQELLLETERGECEAAESMARESLGIAEDQLQSTRQESVRAEEREKAAQAELARLGDKSTLEKAVTSAREIHSEAMRVLEQSRLSDDESRINDRYVDARTALQQREKRLNDLHNEVARLRGVLQGNEGLHVRLADAESAYLEAERMYERAMLEAGAHKRLRELFEQCRDQQVKQVMAPISTRVLEWCKMIGLCEYSEVRFGDQFLPEGIVPTASVKNTAVALENESYGTCEQLSLLIRLALGGILARDEPAVAVLDDPLAHSDPRKHRKILDILRLVAEGRVLGHPPVGRLQILILTCHPDRFDHLTGAKHFDLSTLMTR